MKRCYAGQTVFDWVFVPVRPLAELMELTETESKTSNPLYDTGAIRTRAQCAEIMSILENKVVTESMVRTAEDKGLDKIAAVLMRSELGYLILTAQPGTVEFDVVREALTDLAMES